eukprot:403356028
MEKTRKILVLGDSQVVYNRHQQISNPNPPILKIIQGQAPTTPSSIPSMIKTYLVENFDSVIFVFDLNNLKSLNSIRMFMKLLPLINQINTRSSDSSIQITKEEQEQMNDWKNVQEKMRKVPILIVGNKQDLINQSKAQYLKINVKVMKVIKELDSEKQCTYIESGISSLEIIWKYFRFFKQLPINIQFK